MSWLLLLPKSASNFDGLWRFYTRMLCPIVRILVLNTMYGCSLQFFRIQGIISLCERSFAPNTFVWYDLFTKCSVGAVSVLLFSDCPFCGNSCSQILVLVYLLFFSRTYSSSVLGSRLMNISLATLIPMCCLYLSL